MSKKTIVAKHYKSRKQALPDKCGKCREPWPCLVARLKVELKNERLDNHSKQMHATHQFQNLAEDWRKKEVERDEAREALGEIIAITMQTFYPSVVGRGVPYGDVKERLTVIYNKARAALAPKEAGSG